MLHLAHMHPGTHVDLPEVAARLGLTDANFEIVTVHPGGMGVCVRVRHPAAPDTFALKCIHPQLLGDQESITRFRDEVEMWLSASACDAVAEAIAVVRINEIPAVVARWFDAGDLGQALPLLSPSARFEAIIRICRTLRWVHSDLGVIHRDLKPANVLMDRTLLAHVSDWGLARPLRTAIAASLGNTQIVPPARPDRTHPGSFLGTALYAAPEQFIDASSVDHRADIYSLGCIMHELEAGAPPFAGPDVPSLARLHLNQTPPRLGGSFKRTTLGLEHVTSRCLSKEPSERYQSYAELETDLTSVAESRGFSTTRCNIGLRSKVHHLRAESAIENLITHAKVRGRGVVVVESNEVAPFLEEAADLMALGRYSEAEVLLRRFFVPELIESGDIWHVGHSLAAQYAFCLQSIRGRLAESLEIYDRLTAVPKAPAEYFVNHSFALLRDSEWERAKCVCELGLTQYSNDMDLLGNYTIALTSLRELDHALKIAKKRLAIRRDVHSLDEAAGVLEAIRDRDRNSNLPNAVSAAEAQSRLIVEGLRLNPHYPVLLLAKIRLLRFAHSTNTALEACQTMMHDQAIPILYRQHAFAELVDAAAGVDAPDAVLRIIENYETHKMDEPVVQRVMATRRRVLTDIMEGRTNDVGARLVIKEVADYVLKDASRPDREAVTRARALLWMGHVKKAEATLRSALGDPDLFDIDWDARAHLVRLLRDEGRVAEALAEARRLVEIAPWRAGSYDELRRVAEKIGNLEMVQNAKESGDRVYEEELELFKRLRQAIE